MLLHSHLILLTLVPFATSLEPVSAAFAVYGIIFAQLTSALRPCLHIDTLTLTHRGRVLLRRARPTVLGQHKAEPYSMEQSFQILSLLWCVVEREEPSPHRKVRAAIPARLVDARCLWCLTNRNRKMDLNPTVKKYNRWLHGEALQLVVLLIPLVVVIIIVQ